jgi:hypothetical protein
MREQRLTPVSSVRSHAVTFHGKPEDLAPQPETAFVTKRVTLEVSLISGATVPHVKGCGITKEIALAWAIERNREDG